MIQNTYRAVDSKTNFVKAQFTINSKTWNGPMASTIYDRAADMLSHCRGSYHIERYNGSDWQYAGISISKQRKDMNEVKDLGTMNGWYKGNPPEYDAHLAKCGKPHPTFPQYRHFNMTIKKLGNCYYAYHCHDCGILYRVDSSD